MKEIVFLDTETSGLGSSAEIVEIGIVGLSGHGVESVLLDTLVKPVSDIPEEATRIHGITNEMVSGAPVFAELYPLLVEQLSGKSVYIYNKAYDTQIIDNACIRAGLPLIEFDSYCLMLPFSELYGDWNDYKKSYRWQKLTTAFSMCDDIHQDDRVLIQAHRAVGDSIMSKYVYKLLKQKELI
ncbi:3'-5' exonuclease (plasmid) [Klebsiella pneumoniae]|nr:3'-5' exonuclease [Klebsiella pneumoniae]